MKTRIEWLCGTTGQAMAERSPGISRTFIGRTLADRTSGMRRMLAMATAQVAAPLL